MGKKGDRRLKIQDSRFGYKCPNCCWEGQRSKVGLALRGDYLQAIRVPLEDCRVRCLHDGKSSGEGTDRLWLNIRYSISSYLNICHNMTQTRSDPSHIIHFTSYHFFSSSVVPTREADHHFLAYVQPSLKT